VISLSQAQFNELANKAIDSLPSHIIDNMKNAAIIIEDEPSKEQRIRLRLSDNQTLYGLYEGVPLTNRPGNYGLVAPDKITLFKKPLEQNASTLQDLENRIKRTIWHEIAHHYGLDHQKINEIENNHNN
jgi:predicted Zn-dependent protease with MMP-like domain